MTHHLYGFILVFLGCFSLGTSDGLKFLASLMPDELDVNLEPDGNNQESTERCSSVGLDTLRLRLTLFSTTHWIKVDRFQNLARVKLYIYLY